LAYQAAVNIANGTEAVVQPGKQARLLAAMVVLQVGLTSRLAAAPLRTGRKGGFVAIAVASGRPASSHGRSERAVLTSRKAWHGGPARVVRKSSSNGGLQRSSLVARSGTMGYAFAMALAPRGLPAITQPHRAIVASPAPSLKPGVRQRSVI
jgi:hypothetical protein